MALLDFGRSRVTRLAAKTRQNTWRRAALEVAETSLVLMGIGIGILTLCFALVLMHGVLH